MHNWVSVREVVISGRRSGGRRSPPVAPENACRGGNGVPASDVDSNYSTQGCSFNLHLDSFGGYYEQIEPIQPATNGHTQIAAKKQKIVSAAIEPAFQGLEPLPVEDTRTYHIIGEVVVTASPFEFVLVMIVVPGRRASNGQNTASHEGAQLGVYVRAVNVIRCWPVLAELWISISDAERVVTVAVVRTTISPVTVVVSVVIVGKSKTTVSLHMLLVIMVPEGV